MNLLRIAILTFVMLVGSLSTAHAGIGFGLRYSHVRTEGFDDNSGMIGAFARLKKTLVGFELSADKRKDNYDGSEFDVTQFTGSVMLTPLPVAHLLAGAGLYRTETYYLSDPELQTDNTIGFHYGAGVEWPLLPLLKLAGDLRYRVLNYEFDDGNGGVLEIDGNGYSVSAGLILYLK